jgi:hypothetical protein
MSFSSIALGGGGVRGGLHIGGLAALESVYGVLPFPDGIYGSSVGAIVATALAFGLRAEQMRAMFESHFDLQSVLPRLGLSTLIDFNKQKGMFTMDLFEETVVNAFQSQGIDLRNKRIQDAPKRLFIVASNLTTQRVSILTGSVPILDALRSTSCIPFLFQPQILYNQVYVDGGLFAHSLHDIVPPDCLVFHISYPNKPLFPTDLAEMTIGDMVRHIYVGKRTPIMTPNTVWFQNDSVQILQPITSEHKKLLYDEGYSQTLRFLDSKRAAKEML